MSSILDLPQEILAKIIDEAKTSRSPTYVTVLKSPDDYEAIERTTDSLLACRLVNKKFSSIATHFCGPQFIQLLPKLQALTKGVRFSTKDMNSSTVGFATSDLTGFIFAKRLRQTIPFVIDKIFTKPEDRAKAKDIFAGFTFLVGSPETLIASRVANYTHKIVFLDSFPLQREQCHQFVGGAMTFAEDVQNEDIGDLLNKKRKQIRTQFKSPAKYLGLLIRHDHTTPASFRLNRTAFNNLAAEFGCSEWSLAEDEKQFLFPRFLLAIHGFTNMAINWKTINFSIVSKGLTKSPNVPFMPNKIPLKEKEVAPMFAHKKAQYPCVEVFQQIKQKVLDLNPTFHSYEEVEQFYTLLRGFTNTWVLGNLRMANLCDDRDFYRDVEAKTMKKYVENTLPIVEFIKTETSFVPAVESSMDPPFDVAYVATHIFKLIFSDSLQLKVTIQILFSERGSQMVNVYVNGIGWKPMTAVLKEKDLERLLIAYSGPYEPRNSKYPKFKFRHQEVVDIIDRVLNQYVVGKKFSLEWLIRKLILDVEDFRVFDTIVSLSSIETYYTRPASKPVGDEVDSDSDSGSGPDPEDLILNSNDSDAEHYESDSDDASSDSYQSNNEQQNEDDESDSDSDSDSD